MASRVGSTGDDGKSNREIASLQNRSQRTIEVHRANIMHKLGADGLVDLVKRVTVMGFVDVLRLF
jgi:DNA-binding NarL/FixJ family response regulator